MSDEEQPGILAEDAQSRYRIRLPGFISEPDIGLGDVIKKFTYAVGVPPCAGCEERATYLNHWMRFTSR